MTFPKAYETPSRRTDGEATHYIELWHPNGSAAVETFWLDPDAFERGEVHGNAGWDEQCPNCGASINENYVFSPSKVFALCTNKPCSERFEVLTAASRYR